MINLPKKCYVNNKIPIEKFSDKNTLKKYVKKIKLKYVINQATVNIEEKSANENIAIIEVEFKNIKYLESVIKMIDNDINYNIIFEISYNNDICYSFYYKKVFSTRWNEDIDFTVYGNSLTKIYNDIRKIILGYKDSVLSVDEIVEKQIEIDSILKDIEKLENKRISEKQLNKKNEIRKEIKNLKVKLGELNG